MLHRHAHRFGVSAAVSRHRCLEHDHTAAHIDDGDRMLIAMRVDTDHVVQLICNHPDRPPALVGGHSGSRSGDENRGRHDCDGSHPNGWTGF